MRPKKGSFEYRKKQKLMLGLGVLLGAVVIGIFFILSKTLPKDYTNIMVVMAILTVLPVANVLVTLIAIFPFKSVEKSEYEKVRAVCQDGILVTELAITGTKIKTIPIEYAYVHPNGIVAYTSADGLNLKESEDYIVQTMRAGGNQVSIKIFTDFSRFLDRIKNLEKQAPVVEAEASDRLLRQKAGLLAISL